MPKPLTQTTGRRKEAVARVRLRPGSGKITINKRTFEDYFPSPTHRMIATEPLRLAEVDTQYEYTMAHSYGGYTTNVPLADLLDGKAWVAHTFDGKDLEPEHGGPARLLVPHLYFWKSAKWVNGLQMLPQDQPGFWEQNGYNMYGDPWKEQRYW